MQGLLENTLAYLGKIVIEREVILNCIEIYNEKARNLLKDRSLSKNWKEIVSKSEIKLGLDWKTQA